MIVLSKPVFLHVFLLACLHAFKKYLHDKYSNTTNVLNILFGGSWGIYSSK